MDKIEKVLSDIGLHFQLISYRIVNHLAQEYPEIKLSTNQNYLIYLLSQNPEISNQQIAQSLNISKSAATQLVQSLINHGLITKSPRSDDLRSNVICFTDKAYQYQQTIMHQITLEIANAFGSNFSNKDLETFLKTRDCLRRYHRSNVR